MTLTIQSPPWRVGVDVGGTFTDLVIADSDGRTEVFKVPSVPSDPGEGVINALITAAAAIDQPMDQFLGDCQFFLHGSTVATNTLLEGKGARVGLLTTKGFRDSLEARQYRKLTTHPDMILQYAHYLRDAAAARGEDIAVYGRFRARLNGRKYQQFIDPEADLSQVEWAWWGAKAWVLPEE